jgi:hypothetical protein
VKKFALSFLLILFPVPLLCNTCIDGKPVRISGLLCGNVIDPTGASVSDAALRVVDDSGKVVADAKADSKGDLIFPGISTGRYRLTTTSEGWRIQFGRFEVIRAASSCRRPVTVELGVISCSGTISKKRPKHFSPPRGR